MKLAKAKAIIKESAGYRVEFEMRDGGLLVSDHFPDNDEETIPSEYEAWMLAKGFAKAREDSGIVNVYVIHGDDFTPVDDYEAKKLNIYPPKESDNDSQKHTG